MEMRSLWCAVEHHVLLSRFAVSFCYTPLAHDVWMDSFLLSSVISYVTGDDMNYSSSYSILCGQTAGTHQTLGICYFFLLLLCLVFAFRAWNDGMLCNVTTLVIDKPNFVFYFCHERGELAFGHWMDICG